MQYITVHLIDLLETIPEVPGVARGIKIKFLLAMVNIYIYKYIYIYE